MPAGFLAIPTDDYTKTYQREGRGITQYTLNLSHHEKQELWRYLDNDMVAGAHRNFNFLKNNCASMCMVAVESVMWKEDFHVKAWPEPMSKTNGAILLHLTRHAPWLRFVMMPLFGSEADAYWDQEYRISPELIGEVLTNADIINNEGNRRTALNGTPTTLLAKEKDFSPSPFTPNRVFGCLLALTILLTFCEWKWGWKRIPKAFDAFLLAAQTIIGCALLYVTCVTCLFGLHWNWLLIPFNPLPFLIWMLFRKKRNYHIVYGVYAIVLLLFIVLMPFVTTQVITAHLLLVMIMAARCVFKYFNNK